LEKFLDPPLFIGYTDKNCPGRYCRIQVLARLTDKHDKQFQLYFTGLLLLFGTYLAWETRKVHIPALNDSKLIGMCVYNTVILFTVVIPVKTVLLTNPTASFALMAFLTIFCTSFTLCVVFIPKVTNDKRV
jgi:hypothetical protein